MKMYDCKNCGFTTSSFKCLNIYNYVHRQKQHFPHKLIPKYSTAKIILNKEDKEGCTKENPDDQNGTQQNLLEEVEIEDERMDESDDQNFVTRTDLDQRESEVATLYKQELKIKTYICHLCPLNTRIFKDFINHGYTSHAVKKYKCEFCSYSFATKGTLKTHIRIHTKEKRYKCHVCLKSFSTHSSRKSHMTTHTHEKPYRCCICPTSFSTCSARNNHITTHTHEKQVMLALGPAGTYTLV